MDDFDLSQINTSGVAFIDEAEKHPYTTARLKFIAQTRSIEEFAQMEGLSEKAVILMKEEKWEELRDSVKKENPSLFKNLGALIMDNAFKVDFLAYQLHEAQVSRRLQFLKEYERVHGDLFIRNKEGQIVLDINRVPMSHSVPSGVFERAEKILKYVASLSEIDQIHKRLRGEVVEVDAKPVSITEGYMHLLESKK